MSTQPDVLARHARARIALFNYQRAADALRLAASEFADAERVLDAERRAIPVSQPTARRLSRLQCLVGMAVVIAAGGTLLLWAVLSA